MTDSHNDKEGHEFEDREHEDGEGSEGWRGRMVPELVKRLFVAGMGAVFTSEEGIRRLASEVSLPKDVASYLITQAQTTKDELFRIVAGEIREFLESINLGAELTKILTSLTFEIKMQVRLLPNEKDSSSIRPDVKGTVKVVKRED
ncbi:MAG: hypothetical protein ABI333_07715 [bacterium]